MQASRALESVESSVVQETGTGIVPETAVGIVQETGTGIVQETGTGIFRCGARVFLSALCLAIVVPLSASAFEHVPAGISNTLLNASKASDARGQVMLLIEDRSARMTWFATLDNGAPVILSGFGDVNRGVVNIAMYGLCAPGKVVDAGTGDNVVDAGTGENVVDAGTGSKVVDAGTGNKVVDAGTGDKVVDAGTGDKSVGCGSVIGRVVDAGTGENVVDAGTGNKVVDAGTGNKVVEGGTGDKRATFMGTFEGIFECGTLSGFYTGPDGGNSMFVEFAAPGPRSLRCGTPVAIQ